MQPMPTYLPRAVHTALQRWHTGTYPELPWREMLTVAQCLAACAAPTARPPGPALQGQAGSAVRAGGAGGQPVPNLGLAVKEVLWQALHVLDARPGSNAAQILRLRFLDRLTAQETANRLNLTENIVYKQQRPAIEALAAAIWQAETAAWAERAERIAGRLEIQGPPALFGVEDKLADLLAALTAEGPPGLVAVAGIGGIGKTSLADAAVRALMPSPRFTDIAWVSARQSRFGLWGGLRQISEERPALTLEGLVDAVVEQLGLRDLASLPSAQKQAGLAAHLKARPYLIVVDNLETAADYHALLPHLQALVAPATPPQRSAGRDGPTRVLLTSRHGLQEYEHVFCLTLDELSPADSLALLRHQARERGLHDVAAEPDETLLQVCAATGGNPLALKLVVGQMHAFSIPQIVDDLRQARGRPIEELYHYIYWRAWHLLTDDARQVLITMPLVAESGGRLEQIAAVSGLADDRLPEALRQLITLSLVNVHGTAQARRYGIHRLTETFLLNEVIKWQ